MTHELLAVILGTLPDTLPDPLVVVGSGDLVAVLLPARTGFSLRNALRRQRVADAPRRMELLETLMPFGPVMPAVPGVRLSLEATSELLAVNAPLIQTGMDRLRGKSQFQIKVTWQQDRVLHRFRDTPELGPLFAAGEVAPRQVTSAVERLSARLHAQIADTLDEIAVECAELPREEAMIANTVLLVCDEAHHVLDAAVQKIDAIWPDGFRIQQIGPSPAMSFCALRVEAIGRAEQAAARRLLETPADTSLLDVQRARQAALRAGLKPADHIRRAARIVEAELRLSQPASQLHLVELYGDAQSWHPTQVAVA
ncbi:MAG: GvpL/GvpF family gas vesicle protein [Pseudomonadota bacterium]